MKLGKTQLKDVSPTQTLANRPKTPNLKTNPTQPKPSSEPAAQLLPWPTPLLLLRSGPAPTHAAHPSAGQRPTRPAQTRGPDVPRACAIQPSTTPLPLTSWARMAASSLPRRNNPAEISGHDPGETTVPSAHAKAPRRPTNRNPCLPSPSHLLHGRRNPSSAALAQPRRAEPLRRCGRAALPHPGPPLAAQQLHVRPRNFPELVSLGLRHHRAGIAPDVAAGESPRRSDSPPPVVLRPP